VPALVLTDRIIVHVDGAEAEHFLQNLVTANIETLEVGDAQPAALLTPQGKILFDFLISRAPESGYQLDVRADIVDDLVRRLTLYKLRAAVTFEKLAETPVIAGWESPAPEAALRDQRFPEQARVWRLYGSGSVVDANRPDWDTVRISYGVVESGADYALSDAFPHELLMDKNHGVDFRKGCYVGQEVVSRMQHRGTARKRPATVTAEAQLPETGTPLLAGEKPVGTLGTVVGTQALAIVRTDRVADALAGATPLTAAGIPVSLTLPEWTGLSFKSDDDTAVDA
jgi:folate-binding protein YgfZ